MSKFDEILDKLDKVPPHTGYDMNGLIVATTYIGNLMKEATNAAHANELTKEESTHIFSVLGKDIQKLKERIKKVRGADDASEQREKLKNKSRELLKGLGITYSVQAGEDAVKITDLYELFSNEDKFNEVVRKLKMKAFW